MVQYESVLIHHGVKGMKWGVRRYQNPDGSYTKIGRKKYDVLSNRDVHLAKGSKTFRISIDKDDKTWDNKKYVSLSKKDNKRWNNYIGKSYKRRGKTVYSNTYEIKKDLKIASTHKVGEEFVKLYNNKKLHNSVYKDTVSAYNSMGVNHTPSKQESGAINLAYQTKTGKKIVNNLLKQGYSGMVDRHGLNVGNLPIIIFNPEKNMKLVKSKRA